MMKLFALSSAINLVLGLVSNLRLILTLAVLGTFGFFGYLMYHNGLDVSLAFGEVKGLWLSVWDWFQRGRDWFLSVMPF